MTTLSLRLRLPSGQATLQIAPEATLSELLAQIAATANLTAEGLIVSVGFPPKPLALDDDGAPISSVLQNMDTLMVAVPAAAAAPATATKKGRGRGRGAGASSANNSPAPSGGRGSGVSGGVVTLSDVSGGGSSRKRPAAAASAGGKRRAKSALTLGSEEGIGSSLVGAVSGRKGAGAAHTEDPAQAFLKAAAQSALAHHVEEVHANERFQAALGIAHGSCTFADREDGRRLDGAPTACDVTFKVGRATRVESFALLGTAELRAVLRVVLDQLQGADDDAADDGGRPTSLELLKPFKMAHASPRVFWNVAKLYDGDIAGGLRALLPDVDWSFLDEREKRRSGKAIANAAQEAAAEAAKAARRAARQARAPAAAAADAAGEDAAAPEEAAEPAAGVDAQMAAAEAAEEEAAAVDEPADDDAAGWEAVGTRAMLKEGEYDYACVCLNRSLEIRIADAGGREVEDSHPALARPWYLHGSALLRRAQAMAVRASDPDSGGGADDGANDGAGDGAGGAEEGAAAREAVGSLGEEWQREGSGAIGRRVRRFFALHGQSDGTCIAWQPPISADAAGEGEEEEEALYRVVMDDGDVEDLDDAEMSEALEAHQEGRTVAMEVEGLLEAAWESLEMAVALYRKGGEGDGGDGDGGGGGGAAASERCVGLSEAHERLGDAALQNDQPERALEEYTETRRLLIELKDAAVLTADDRRLADIEWYLGVTSLQLGRAEPALAHYRQAAATLRLRRAGLQRAALDQEIAVLAQAADTAGLGDGGGGAADGGGGEMVDEVEAIGELLEEIDARMSEVRQAMGAAP